MRRARNPTGRRSAAGGHAPPRPMGHWVIEHRHAVLAALARQAIAIKRVVVLAEEHALAAGRRAHVT